MILSSDTSVDRLGGEEVGVVSTDDSFRELCCEGGRKEGGASGRHMQSGKAPYIPAGTSVPVVQEEQPEHRSHFLLCSGMCLD